MNRHWLRLACLIGFLSSLPALAQNGAPTSRTAIQFQNAGVNVMYGSGYFKFNVTGSGCSASNVSGVFTLNCSGGGSQVYPSAGVACSTGSAWTACSVTNDVQTKAAVMPNTAPSAGQFPVGNLAGTAYAPQSLSGDCTLASTGAITCTKTNGTGFGTGATATIANYAPLASPQFTGTPAGPNGNLTQTICSGTTTSLASVTVASGGKYGASSSAPLAITCTGAVSGDNVSVDFDGANDPRGLSNERFQAQHKRVRRDKAAGHPISHWHAVSAVSAALLLLSLLCASATAQVMITAQLTDGTGSVATSAYLHFELENCGNNFPALAQPGTSQNPWTIVRTAFDIKPNQPDGSIQSQVLGNDQLLCGNVASTYYRVTAMKDSDTPLAPVGGQPYVICSSGAPVGMPCSNPGGSSWNPALQQPSFQPSMLPDHSTASPSSARSAAAATKATSSSTPETTRRTLWRASMPRAICW